TAQTPTRANSQVQGRFVVAKTRHGATGVCQHASPLPRDLFAAVASQHWWMRRGAVAGLQHLLNTPGMTAAAQQALRRLTIDAVRPVSDAARLALRLPASAEPVTVSAGAAAVLGYELDDLESRSDMDSAPYVPRSVVADPYF